MYGVKNSFLTGERLSGVWSNSQCDWVSLVASRIWVVVDIKSNWQSKWLQALVKPHFHRLPFVLVGFEFVAVRGFVNDHLFAVGAVMLLCSWAFGSAARWRCAGWTDVFLVVSRRHECIHALHHGIHVCLVGGGFHGCYLLVMLLLQHGSIRRWQSTTARRWREGDVIRLWRWRVATAIDGCIWRRHRNEHAQGRPPLRRHGFIKSTPLEGRAVPPPWWWCLVGDLCFLCVFWLVTCQSDISYLHFRGVTKWPT